jgi:hypothetical protein
MTMNIGWPEGIFLLLMLLALIGNVLMSLKRYDELSAFGNFIASLLTFGLLYWGGFFA